MCGIAGKVDRRAAVSPELIDQMCRLLVHRGPDSRGVHIDGRVALGIQRLAVIDIDTGDQPIYNEDRSVVVVLNGEIYNYVELRQELIDLGHRFRTAGDTETIVHLYEEFGTECVTRLRGMFAFALWDDRRQRLLLARDRVGKKPLFYRATPDTIWFASEPRAILRDPEVPRAPDFDAIDTYLRFQYVPHPQSAFLGLRKLPPGHSLTWGADRNGPVVSRYWRIDLGPQAPVSLEEGSSIVRQSLLEATRLRLRADVPLGAFLSGGVDSSAVVAAMSMSGSGKVKTFSIGFDVSGFDETAHAKTVAEHYSTEHRELRVKADAMAILPRMVWHYGEPFADSSALPSFYLAELTRRHVTVALNGDGGDESFAGYQRYAALVTSERLGVLPQSMRRSVAAVAERVGPGQRARTLRSRLTRGLSTLALEPWERYDRWMSYFRRSDLDDLYTPEHAASLRRPLTADAMIRDPWLGSTATSPVEVMLDVDIQTYLPGDLLVKMDIATMAHSLEVRSPFLDHVLMERVAQLAGGLKLSHGVPKALLKHAVRPWLPDSIVDRPKMGFGAPIASWFRTDLRTLLGDVLLDPVATRRGMFRPEAVNRLIADHLGGRAENSSMLWALLALELWFRTYIDARGDAIITLPITASS